MVSGHSYAVTLAAVLKGLGRLLDPDRAPRFEYAPVLPAYVSRILASTAAGMLLAKSTRVPWNTSVEASAGPSTTAASRLPPPWRARSPHHLEPRNRTLAAIGRPLPKARLRASTYGGQLRAEGIIETSPTSLHDHRSRLCRPGASMSRTSRLIVVE
jgi:hypothetical protein